MNREQLTLLLEKGDLGSISEGEWQELPEGRHLTVHVSHPGGALAMSHTRAVFFDGDQLVGKNERGELFIVATADVFAFSLSPEKSGNRQAGFR